MSRIIVPFVILAICLSGCAAAPQETIPADTPTPEPIPTDIPTPEPATLEEISVVYDEETAALEEIIIVFQNLFPEGIEYDEAGERFLLGSMNQGKIFQVSEDGRFETFIEDPDLIECFGLEIDRNNQRLLVVNNDEAEDKSYLHAYDLVTGEKIFISEISSITPDLPHSTEGVVVDADGNAYVTDWEADVIYRVDPEGNPTLFMEDPLFYWINGIVYHPNGYLLLGSNPGLLLKIPLDDPEVIQVEIPEGNLSYHSTLGMLLHPDGTLIMVTSPESRIRRLQSDGDWETARVVASSLRHRDGSRIALRGEEVYIIYSHFDLYGSGTDHDRFEIVHVEFE